MIFFFVAYIAMDNHFFFGNFYLQHHVMSTYQIVSFNSTFKFHFLVRDRLQFTSCSVLIMCKGICIHERKVCLYIRENPRDL